MYEVLEQGVSPITLQEAKDHLRAEFQGEDDLINMYIKAAYKAAEEYTWSKISTTKLREYFQSWSQVLKVTQPITQDTVVVNYIDENGDLQVLTEVYKTDKLYNELYYTGSPSLPTLADQRNAIYVDYYTGYSEVPEDIIVAMLLMITEYYDERIDNIEQIFNINGMYSKSSYILLNSYRRNGFGKT